MIDPVIIAIGPNYIQILIGTDLSVSVACVLIKGIKMN